MRFSGTWKCFRAILQKRAGEKGGLRGQSAGKRGRVSEKRRVGQVLQNTAMLIINLHRNKVEA